jgi:hypothetical protein
MQSKVLAIGFAVAAGFSSGCQAGVIHFQGAIVEPACSVQASVDGRVDLTGCSPASRGSAIEVQALAPTASAKALGGSAVRVRVRVRLMADNSPTERYFDRQYQLLDEAGQPLRSGDYVLTLSMP